MLNVPLLRKTMEHIEQHPWEWFQNAWVCSTDRAVYWLHGVSLDTIQLEFGMPFDVIMSGLDEAGWTCGTAHCFAGWACYFDDDPVTENDALDVVFRASTALGLRAEQASYLFDGLRTMPELRAAVDRYIKEAEALGC